MDASRKKKKRRGPGRLGGLLAQATAILFTGLLCLPLPALAEEIFWNGPGDPANTGTVRPDPVNPFPDPQALFPDSHSGNSVTVNGDVPGNVYGGLEPVPSGGGAATGNSATINSGTISGFVSGGYAQSDSGTATATGNSATINGGSIGRYVRGGDALDDSGPAAATGNSVTITGGSIGDNVFGGYAQSDSGTATAADNSVTISGGTINNLVCGGDARSDSGTTTATGNSVTINGGSIGGDVIGGYAQSNTSDATATHNTVTLSGTPVFGAASKIFGGQISTVHGTTGDAFSGNTLNVRNYTGSRLQSIERFQYYNFTLPAGLQALSSDILVLGDGAGRQSAVIGVNIMGGGAAPQSGDMLTLIRAGTVNGAISNDGRTLSGQKGLSLLYDFQLKQTTAGLTATVIGAPRLNPQTKALAEGRAAGLAFVNQGADLAAGAGLNAARKAGAGFGAFAVGQGGAARYDTGSHVNVDGFSLMTGLAWNQRVGGAFLDKAVLGAFFEAGWGNYDSRNAFSGFASVKGDGDTGYYGGGLLGRLDFASTGPGNFYAETFLRAGWMDTDFSSNDLRDGIGREASYDSGAAYYGAYLGLGYVWNISEASSLDLYTKYFWTHQDGDSVTVANDPIRFNSSDSHRWRGGARFSHDLTTDSGLTFTPYIGAAYEHEFDGKAEATAYGYSLDAPDLKGGTGMAELGLSLTAPQDGKAGWLSLDLGVQGYTGVREGVSGSVQVRFEF